MKINLSKPKEKQLGALRVDVEVYELFDEMSKKYKVSKQAIVRAILEQVIKNREIEITT